MEVKEVIETGKAFLGIELGSTRIKAVLTDAEHHPIASGGFSWDNQFENGVWTYSLDSVQNGIRACYASLVKNIRDQYGITLTSVRSMGISGMMHGYLAFDKAGELLVPFRTWRNTITEEASTILTKEFDYHIPQRWSIAHLYQEILNGEEHVSKIASLTTLAGYIHFKLTGNHVVGMGEASGMFPVQEGQFSVRMIQHFEELIAAKHMPWKLCEILPKPLFAGENAGNLTEEGARFLDPSGNIHAGIPMCPPEGDAGTGMVATDCVAEKTCNVSAGTSIFAMTVLENNLSKAYPEIDTVVTPDGKPVAMVHCNNGTGEIDAWVGFLSEFCRAANLSLPKEALYSVFYREALAGDPDCGGLVSYNFRAGEHLLALSSGCPLFAHPSDSRFTFSNFARTQLFSAIAALRIGLDILTGSEHVKIGEICGHGGLFKEPEAGPKMVACALDTPVSVLETAGEGGPWGMAILASFLFEKELTLPEFLEKKVFTHAKRTRSIPDQVGIEGFERFFELYRKGIAVEEKASELLK